MTSLADLPELIGFFSYSRDDDQDSHNSLTMIRTLIQNELRARLGRSRQSLRLWQDQEAIAPGSMWESQIGAAVQQSAFFIPIITPRVINSKYCGIEFKRFLDRERELGRDDLVFPILYIDVDELQDEKQWRGHPVLEVIGQRQYVDWREYRYESDSPALRRAAASLCAKIATTLRRQQPNERTAAADNEAAQRESDRVAHEQAEKERRQNEEAARARLDEEEKEKSRDRAKAEVLRPVQDHSVSPELAPEGQYKGADAGISKSWRTAIVCGIAGAVPAIPGWALGYAAVRYAQPGAAPPLAALIADDFLLGLVVAIVLYRGALSLGRAAGAGAALAILSSALVFLAGIAGYLVVVAAFLVLAVFDPRLRTWPFLLKVLGVSILNGLGVIGAATLHQADRYLSYDVLWISVGLTSGIIVGLIGYELAQRPTQSSMKGFLEEAIQ
jgi:hypothetical protein